MRIYTLVANAAAAGEVWELCRRAIFEKLVDRQARLDEQGREGDCLDAVVHECIKCINASRRKSS